MEKFTHGSLFSGIGGFDLAAEWMGWENKFHCEWNEFGQKVLHHYWPNAECFTDITKSDFTKYANKIDILTGGFPCQPYSSAGKRKGKEDERHLWPEMLRAIREISPRFVVGENVRGLTNWNGGLVFDEVCAELESLGYQVAPIIIPACAINAPHRRERIWFVATNTQSNGWKERREGLNKWKKYQFQNGDPVRGELTTISEIPITSNTESNGSTISKLGESESRQQVQAGSDIDGFKSLGVTTDTESKGSTRLFFGEKKKHTFNGITCRNGDATDTDSRGLERTIKVRRDSVNVERESEFGLTTDTRGIGLQRKGESTQLEGGRFGFDNTQNNKTTWDKFPTQSPICGGDDGIPTQLDRITFPKWRAESIKAYGNAIVPQVAYQIFQAIEKSLYL